MTWPRLTLLSSAQSGTAWPADTGHGMARVSMEEDRPWEDQVLREGRHSWRSWCLYRWNCSPQSVVSAPALAVCCTNQPQAHNHNHSYTYNRLTQLKKAPNQRQGRFCKKSSGIHINAGRTVRDPPCPLWRYSSMPLPVDTYVWSADGEVAVNGHHSQQADTGHAKEDVESCIDLETKTEETLPF